VDATLPARILIAGLWLGLGCVSSFATALQASEVYKWIDSDGNVHYSTSPPPEAYPRASRIAPSGIIREGERLPAAVTLGGEWRSYSDGIEQKLSLIGGATMKFSWSEARDDQRAERSKVKYRGSGQWGELNGVLRLRYEEDRWSGSPHVGEAVEFRIIDRSSTELTLAAVDGRVYRFVKADAAGLGSPGRLSGTWVHDVTGEQLRFQGQGFSLNVAPKQDWQPQVEGNWSLDGARLTLRYVASTVAAYKAGDVDEYNLEYVDDVRLILRKHPGGEWVRFQRP
jgi:hypothetical protein